jgi:uncharacterized protein YgbK (DUF1537 family)
VTTVDPPSTATRRPWPTDPLPGIRQGIKDRSVVVYDDDPTGTQTLRDVTVWLRWSTETLVDQLRSRDPVIYLLANSRSLDEGAATTLARTTGESIRAAVGETAWPVSVVSRSDSTLRGHFPQEVDALATGLGMREHRTVLAPFFADGGRVTIDDVHLIRDGDRLIPVAETPFARDPVFGYRSSNLRDWIAEKSRSTDRPVASVSIDLIRSGGPGAVRDAVLELPPQAVCVVNALVERDIEVAAAGVALAEEAGVEVIARTAASYVRARIGLPVHPPLTGAELGVEGTGMVVMGSHVPMSTVQLERLVAETPRADISTIELEVDRLLAAGDRGDRAITTAATKADAALASGRMPVVFTSRELRRGGSIADDVRIAATISDALCELVTRLRRPPAWFIAKGGITSHELAAKGFGYRSARVIGQLLPGVAVWRSGGESRWPGMLYVVFPGNVGKPDALLEATRLLAGRRDRARTAPSREPQRCRTPIRPGIGGKP